MNIQFSAAQRKSIDEMAGQLGTSQAGVLRAALSLLSIALREQQAGKQIGIVKDGQVVKEVSILDT